MPISPAADFESILRALGAREVDVIVVGGICAILNGAPVNTPVLDLVHSRDPANLRKLVAALREMKAHYRTHPRHRIQPTATTLAATGAHLLITRFGPLDLLGTIAPKRDYGDLLPLTTETRAGPGLRIRLLTLEGLIESKEAAGRAKDLAVLPVLRQTLKENRKRNG